MEGSTPTSRWPLSRRTTVLISSLVGAAAFLVAFFIIGTFAKRALLIEQPFNNAQAANTFAPLVDAGKWEVKNGAYELSDPVAVATAGAGNANISVNKTEIKAAEWRLETTAKALAGSDERDFSVIFDYTDEQNYYFVNFSTQKTQYSNGIFKVENGKQSLLAALPSTITAGTDYAVEVRKDDTQIKVYRNKEYLAKASGQKLATVKVGYGTRGSAAVFDNLVVSGDGVVTNPTPTPTPPPTPTPTPPPTPPTVPPTPSPTPVPGGGRAVSVSTAEQLEAALATAMPGDVITMTDGTYTPKDSPSVMVGSQNASAKFRLARSGTADKPIVLQGSRNAIIDGKSTGGDYGLHLFKSNYVHIKGIRVTNAKKGIMLDGSNHVVIDGVMIDTIGHEGVHFRTNSSDNILRNSFITKLGLNNENYGEAVYIGSSDNNWSTLNGGKADEADRNQVINNTITAFTAEGIDLKEAASNNLIKGNYFDGSGMGVPDSKNPGKLKPANSGDSWIDIKGDNNTITENSGDGLPVLAKDSAAFQVHTHGPSGYNSASNNRFSKNTVNITKNMASISSFNMAAGYGFLMSTGGTGNIVTCDNIVGGLAAGFGYNGFKCNG